MAKSEGGPHYTPQGSLAVMLRNTPLAKILSNIGYDPSGPLLPTEVIFGETLWHLIRRQTKLTPGLQSYAEDYKRRSDCHGSPEQCWTNNEILDLRTIARKSGINLETALEGLEKEFSDQFK